MEQTQLVTEKLKTVHIKQSNDKVTQMTWITRNGAYAASTVARTRLSSRLKSKFTIQREGGTPPTAIVTIPYLHTHIYQTYDYSPHKPTRIFNSAKICRSYRDLKFGITFFWNTVYIYVYYTLSSRCPLTPARKKSCPCAI